MATARLVAFAFLQSSVASTSPFFTSAPGRTSTASTYADTNCGPTFASTQGWSVPMYARDPRNVVPLAFTTVTGFGLDARAISFVLDSARRTIEPPATKTTTTASAMKRGARAALPRVMSQALGPAASKRSACTRKLKSPKRKLYFGVEANRLGVCKLDGRSHARPKSRVRLVVVCARGDDGVSKGRKRRARDLHLHVGQSDGRDPRLAHDIDLVAAHPFLGTRGDASRGDGGVEKGPGQDQTHIPVGHVGDPSVACRCRARGRWRPSRAPRQRRRGREVRPQIGADRARVFFRGPKVCDGFGQGRVPALRHLDRLAQCGHLARTRRIAADVDSRVRRSDGRGQDVLRDRETAPRLDAANVEAGQLRFCPREVDRRSQPGGHAGAGEVPVCARE